MEEATEGKEAMEDKEVTEDRQGTEVDMVPNPNIIIMGTRAATHTRLEANSREDAWRLAARLALPHFAAVAFATC